MQLLSKMFAVDAAVNGGDVVAGLVTGVGDFRNFASADGTGGDDAVNFFFQNFFLTLINLLHILVETIFMVKMVN